MLVCETVLTSLSFTWAAVLMLDDDTLVSVPDISFAFSVWKVIGNFILSLKCSFRDTDPNFSFVMCVVAIL